MVDIKVCPGSLLNSINASTNWILSWHIIGKKYTCCKIHRRKRKLDNFEIGIVWNNPTGKKQNFAHDSFVDAKAQTGNVAHLHCLKYIDVSHATHPLSGIFWKSEHSDMSTSLNHNAKFTSLQLHWTYKQFTSVIVSKTDRNTTKAYKCNKWIKHSRCSEDWIWIFPNANMYLVS